MGLWLNIAFINTHDLDRLEAELVALLDSAGRTRVHPMKRTPERYDPMQYGKPEQVRRWGLAAFAAAEGWCALQTAPLTALLEPGPPLLARLARRLGVDAFQYNAFDGDSQVLLEAGADGGLELSGFVGAEPERFWNGEPREDRLAVRFRRVDVARAAELARRREPAARLEGRLYPEHRPDQVAPEHEEMWRSLQARAAAKRARLREWVPSVGGELREDSSGLRWRCHPADVVLALASERADLFEIEPVIAPAICAVFGGARASACDNRLPVEILVPHARTPEGVRIVYAEAS